MDIYYVGNNSIRIAQDEDFILVRDGYEVTLEDKSKLIVDQLLCIADSASNAQILFDEFYMRKVKGLELTSQSFNNIEFLGLHQDVLNDSKIFPYSALPKD